MRQRLTQVGRQVRARHPRASLCRRERGLQPETECWSIRGKRETSCLTTFETFRLSSMTRLYRIFLWGSGIALRSSAFGTDAHFDSSFPGPPVPQRVSALLVVISHSHLLDGRYHKLHPEYVHGRLREMGRGYTLRVLLVLIDMADSDEALRELSRVAVGKGLSLLVASSEKEAGRYIETFKLYENKPADMLQVYAPLH